MAEKRFLRELKDFDAAHIWPGTTLDVFQKTKKIGKPIFLERINTYVGNSKRILDEAYARLGIPPNHGITPEKIQAEQAELELADFIWGCSPEVIKSFQEAGVPDEKIIPTSYGWCPTRFPTIHAEKPPTDEFTVLFLGTVGVRKGVHLLLRAWERANIKKGRLIIFGQIEPAIAETCRDLLARPDVIRREFSINYASAYREADLFAFPSLEEGSPLVTYEAMAHGLPMLMSPMGAGGVVRDGIDGMVLPPYEEDAWVEALRKFANNPDLCKKFGESGRQWVQEFTWEKVAARRAASMQELLKAA
ncbi:glycosyltransferase family 4 protein [Microcoleus sp. FACHB-53]|nr:glycosyltransferase family 4 protein [Microcoleus sp. FACHB-53]